MEKGPTLVGGTISPNRSEHRANYTLERGVWFATCKLCGFQVSDPVRQRAATIYREHIKEERLAVPVVGTFVIDVTDSDVPGPAQPVSS